MSGWWWVAAGYVLTVGTWAALIWMTRTPRGRSDQA